eukprot:COSAG04_NODE_304_length_17311_cov_13.648792_9_plen_69_part_00
MLTHAAELRHVNVTSVILIVVGHDGLEADVGAKEKLRARRRRRRRVGLFGETAQGTRRFRSILGRVLR